MKKERFKTKLTKRQKRNDILVFLGVMVCSYIFTLWFTCAIGLWEDIALPVILLIGFALTYFVISILMFPVMIAGGVLGMQKGRAKRVREDATFVPVQNMEYYRDNLKDLNPALLSVLIDLDISGKNDIVATLLRMQNKNVIEMTVNGHMDVNAENMERLDAGETELLNMVKNGKLNDRASLSQWSKNRFLEAEKLGYIRKKEVKDNKGSTITVIIWFICLIIAFFVWGAFLGGHERGLDSTERFSMSRSFIYLTVVDILVFVPIYLVFKSLGMRTRKDVLWERTELGNETAEKIAALRRFIHDFSMLSTAEKEEALLWEDYLVYTIVLEDNEKIVKEISKQFGVNLRDVSRIQRRSRK